ncbi:MAG: hypothetical protein ABI210_07625 [Abditibacteriaceae bacterium]
MPIIREDQETIHGARETCLGFPYTDERAITGEERITLEREAKQSMQRGFGWGCGASVALYLVLDIIILLIVYFVPALKHDPNNLKDYPAVVVGITGAFMVGIMYFIIRTKFMIRLRMAAKQDLQKGQIRRYRGLPPGFSVNDTAPESAKPKRQPKLFGVPISPEQPITLEVFSASRRLYRVNDESPKRLIMLPEERTAPQPEEAQTAAKWVEPARIVSDHTIDISQSGKRQLSADEKAELEQRAKTAWRRPAFGAFFFTAYLIGLLWIDRVAGTGSNVGFWEYFFIAATIWVDYMFVKTLWWSSRLLEDVKVGEVIITREPNQMGEGETIKKGNVIEWLTISKQGWSINGQPAPWRLRR